MKVQKYVAEFLGTFTLTLAVSISLVNTGFLPTPIVAALVVGIFVFTVGAISGAHLNPAVTLGLWSVKKIESLEGVFYIVAQLVGAGLAWLVVGEMLVARPALVADNLVTTGVAEAFGAFLLVFGICSLVYEKADDDVSGFVVGGSLLAGLFVASGWSNAILNPAVAVGLNSISWMYILAPVVGGIIAAWLYRFVTSK